MLKFGPSSIDVLIVCGYFAITLLIGYLARSKSGDATQYLNASRSLPVWVVSLSFFAVNCSGLEIVGLSAMSAEYGVTTLHFYLVGAIPAMVFLGLFMIPVYMRSRALSVPEFLSLRFNSETRLLNTVSMTTLSALLAGVSLYAMAQTLGCFLGWSFSICVLTGGALALFYLVLGGLRATIYNELFQLAMLAAGLAPLAVFILADFHGLHGVLTSLPAEKAHLWTTLPIASKYSPLDWVGVFFGLGFVLSFGYWCTDFRLIQRTLTARDEEKARFVPMVAAVGKLCLPLLVVLPGLAAYRLYPTQQVFNYDQAMPRIIQHYYGPGLLGLGMAALLASLMSGLASNVAAFSSLCTRELYRAHICPSKSEEHYIFVARAAMFVGVLLSIASAFIALRFRNLMDYIQFLFSLFNAPLFGAFLLGMFTTWTTSWGGFWGLLIGIVVGICHNFAVRAEWIDYGSQMSGNFYGAIYAFVTTMVVGTVVSMFTATKSRTDLWGESLVSVRSTRKIFAFAWLIIFALALMMACVGLNLYFR